MNHDYSIWRLQCQPNSRVPIAQIEENIDKLTEHNNNLKQEILTDVEAETIQTGDINQTQNIYNQFQSADNFVKLSQQVLKDHNNKFPQSNTILNTIVDKLNTENRLLVIGGEHEDKSDLALYIAIQFFQSLPSDESYQSTKVFIIDNFSPQNLTPDLQQLHESAKIGRNFIIATTEIPKIKWVQTNPDIWWEPKRERLYEKHSLSNFLWTRLKPEIQLKLREFLSKQSESVQAASETQTEGKEPETFLYQQVNDKGLETLSSIFACARGVDQFFQNPEDKLSLSALEEIFKSANNPKESLEKWYKMYLNTREQFLAIALSLFDGLFEDQFFAALEKVVKEVWQQRDSSFQAFDYRDLDNLKNHFEFIEITVYSNKLKDFKFVKTKDYATELQIRQLKLNRVEDRRALFEIVWNSDRRKILTTLEVIKKLVLDSTNNNSYNWELYRSWIRRNNVRKVISTTLSELGMISSQTSSIVQEVLLRFAEKPNIGIQEVTAQAIARWYDQGAVEEFFSIVQLFYNDTLRAEESETQKREEINLFLKLWLRDRESFKFSNLLASLPLNRKNPVIKVLISLFSRANNTSFNRYQKDYYIGSERYFDIDKRRVYPWTFAWTERIIDRNCYEIANVIISRTLYYREQLTHSDKRKINAECIGATVALTMSSVMSQMENLWEEKEFYNWLDELSESKFPLVHIYFGYYTLFFIVPPHLDILGSWLKNTAQRHTDFLNHAIALSLAQSYNYSRQNRNQVKQILREWFNECNQRRNAKGEIEKNSKYDALIRTTVLAYGLIEYDQLDSEGISLQEVFNFLSQLIKKEKNELVRSSIVSALYSLSYRYFSDIEVQLRQVLDDLTNDEQENLVKIVTNIYLEQRASLQGGDEEIFIKGQRYQVWLDSDRRSEHPTAVEEVLFRWVRRLGNEGDNTGNSSVAQQFALRAFASFARELEQREEMLIQELKEMRNHG